MNKTSIDNYIYRQSQVSALGLCDYGLAYKLQKEFLVKVPKLYDCRFWVHNYNRTRRACMPASSHYMDYMNLSYYSERVTDCGRASPASAVNYRFYRKINYSTNHTNTVALKVTRYIVVFSTWCSAVELR